MKVRIDFSVYTSDGKAVGHVEGEFDCVVEPMIGDTISLMFASDGKSIPSGHELGGQLKVTDRIITPNKPDDVLALMLSDFVVGTKEQALVLMEYFESGFGLYANFY